MGLLLSEGAENNFRVKHTFNADEDSETLLKTAAAVLKDKTEFINRCIQSAGPAVLRSINAERNKAVDLWLRDSTAKRPAVNREK